MGCIQSTPGYHAKKLSDEEKALKKYYPLHFAITVDDPDEVERVIDVRKSEVNTLCVQENRWKSGVTPLILAIQEERWYIVSLLLQTPNVDFHCSDLDGNAPLHHAVNNAPRDILVSMCKKMPTIDRINKKRETALARASRCRNLDAIQTLLENHADVNGNPKRRGLPLMNAIKRSWVEGARFFIQHSDIDLNAKPGPRGEGFLWCRHSEIIDILLETDVNVSLTDDTGVTADQWLSSQKLHDSADKVRRKRGQLLLEERRRPEVRRAESPSEAGKSRIPGNSKFARAERRKKKRSQTPDKRSRFMRQISTTEQGYFGLKRDSGQVPRPAQHILYEDRPEAGAQFPPTPNTMTPENMEYQNHPLYRTFIDDDEQTPKSMGTFQGSPSSVFNDLNPDYDEPDYNSRDKNRRFVNKSHVNSEDFTSPIV